MIHIVHAMFKWMAMVGKVARYLATIWQLESYVASYLCMLIRNKLWREVAACGTPVMLTIPTEDACTHLDFFM